MRWLCVVISVLLAVVTYGDPAQARPVKDSGLAGIKLFRSIARREAIAQGIPFELIDAVMWVESRHNPRATGRDGEIGIMQILPSTAKFLGFRGHIAQLRKPAVNIHFGTRYLAGAWRLAKGDICTAVMKYRAGHGESRFSVLSVRYCKNVRRHMAKAGFEVTGEVPKPTFGFRTAGAGKRGTKGFVRSPRTKGCYARVVQPGPRFGTCIPMSKLLKKGLVVKVTRPKKRK